MDPATLAHSTVSIMRHFDDKEMEARPGVLGIRATGWFRSPMLMATVEHVTAAMHLSDRDWKHVEIRKGESKQSILPASGLAPVPPRTTSPWSSCRPRLPVHRAFLSGWSLSFPRSPVSLAYPDGVLRVAGGRFVRYGDNSPLAGTALLEMYDGNDRLVLDYGASGAPVFDCTGRVVAVVSNLFTTSMQFMSRTIRISTAWGQPNVVSVPVSVLKDFARVD